ncbi:hypothetical protein D3C86_1283050 [compost metagenome]
MLNIDAARIFHIDCKLSRNRCVRVIVPTSFDGSGIFQCGPDNYIAARWVSSDLTIKLCRRNVRIH